MEYHNRMLCALSPTDVAAISPYLSEVTLRQDEMLHEVGEVVSNVYFPLSAVLSVVTVMNDGRAVESATVGFEAAVGLTGAMSRLPSASRAFAQIGGDAIRLDAQRLRQRAAESSVLNELIFKYVDISAGQAEQTTACNVLHPVGPRLARWLLMTQDRTEGDNLPLTQEYLAVMLGVQRTTISKFAGEFKDLGLIRYSRGTIKICDREGLQRESCECYAAQRTRLADVWEMAKASPLLA